MKAIILSTITMLSVSLFASNKPEIEERKLEAFTEISLRIGANLYLVQDTEQSLQIKGKPSTLDKIITEVNGRKLIIRYNVKNDIFKKWNPGPVDIYVSMPQIEKLIVSGSGMIEAEEKIEAKIIDLFVSGSGDIKLHNVSVDKLSANVSGSGDIMLGGSKLADDVKFLIAGSGDIVADNLEAKNVNVKITGSGDCRVFATERLYSRIVGSGSVEYSGNPQVDSQILGSGDIRER